MNISELVDIDIKNQRKIDQVIHRSEVMPPQMIYWKFRKGNISHICGKEMRGRGEVLPSP